MKIIKKEINIYKSVEFKMLFLTLCLALIFGVGLNSVSAASGDVIYVNGSHGNDSWDGLSWDTAKLSIKNATGTVNTNGTVNIANGIYTGENNTGVTVDKDMSIYGQSQNGTVIDAQNSAQIFTVVKGVNLTIWNLTLTNGKVNGAGGAIVVNGSCTVENCTFITNTATIGGGAISNTGSCSMRGCTFVGNRVSGTGGAISNTGSCTVDNCIFNGNRAYGGGAVYNSLNSGPCNLTNCNFVNNTASNYGGTIYNNGFCSVYNSNFTTNFASYNGGAIYSTSTLNITGTTFTGNHVAGSYGGGAIYSDDNSFTVNECTFKNNTADTYGGAISSKNSCNITGSTFTGNSAVLCGGAIYKENDLTVMDCFFRDNNAAYGGAVYTKSANRFYALLNCTFSDNNATDGGAIYNNGTCNVSSCNFVNNTATNGGALYTIYDMGTVHFSSFSGNIATGEADVIYCSNNYSGALDANLNWWGSNEGPASGSFYGGVNTNLWLVLTVKTDLDVVSVGGNSTVTADLRHDNGGNYHDPFNGHVSDRVIVNFTVINGAINITRTTLTNGQVQPIFTANARGTASVTATIDNQTNTVNITVNPTQTNIIALDVSNFAGQDVTLKAYVTDYYGNPVNVGQVKFTVNGEDAGTVNVNNGVASCTWMIPVNWSVGNYTIIADFIGTGNYNSSSGNGHLTVNQTITYTCIDNVSNFAGQDVTLKAYVTDYYGNPVNEGQVRFTVNDIVAGTVNVSNGVAVYRWTIPSGWSTGNYVILAGFIGTGNYAGSTNESTLTVNRTPTNTVVNNSSGFAGQTVYLTAHVVDYYGNPVNVGQVKFTVNGKGVGTVNVNNGVASCTWMIPVNWSVGNYTIIADFIGTGNYSSSYGNKTLNVTRTPTKITVDNKTGAYGETVNLMATLTDCMGNPLSGEIVTFTVNSKSYDVVTDNTGTATANYTISQTAGLYDIAVDFDGGSEYVSSNGTGNLTVDKAVTGIIAGNVTGIYGEAVDLTAKLTDGSGNPLSGRTVTFTVDGVTVGSAVTDGNGLASLEYTLSQKAGLYIIGTVFAGDDYYSSVSGIGNLTVDKAVTGIIAGNVTGVYGETVDLTAKLTDDSGNPLSGRTVTFTVDGKSYNVTTNGSGLASLEYKLGQKAGLYTISVVFAGDDYYSSVSGNGSLTVNGIPTNVAVAPVTGVNGETVNLTATLTDQNGNLLSGKTVIFSVDGVVVGSAVTNGDGVAVFEYRLCKAGDYMVNAVFAGDLYYIKSTGENSVRVSPSAKLYLNPVVSNKNPKVGESFVITYKLGNSGLDAARNVTVTFQIPEGLEFVDVSVDSGKYTYNTVTRTITWTLDTVPVGDPYLYLTVRAVKGGSYVITPVVNSTTYNWNPSSDGALNVKVQPAGGSSGGSGTSGGSTNHVKAASTINMHKAGLPFNYLLLAVLAVLGGLVIPKKKN